jgi:hypothetical protein
VEPAKVASNEVVSEPVKPLPEAPPANVPAEEPPKVASNNVASAPVKPLPEGPPANVQSEEEPKVAASQVAPAQHESAKPKPTESVRTEKKRQIRSNRETQVAAIPTAKPVTPEVRRAEPAAPGEGPEEIAAEPEAEVASEAPSKNERLADLKRRPEKDAVSETRIAGEDVEVRQPMPKLPPGRVRAKFIGVAADGNWMFELPSRKIVIVPAPPGG